MHSRSELWQNVCEELVRVERTAPHVVRLSLPNQLDSSLESAKKLAKARIALGSGLKEWDSLTDAIVKLQEADNLDVAKNWVNYLRLALEIASKFDYQAALEMLDDLRPFVIGKSIKGAAGIISINSNRLISAQGKKQVKKTKEGGSIATLITPAPKIGSERTDYSEA